MTPRFLFSSYAVIAVILLFGLMGPTTSIAKPSSADLLPVEAQAPPPRQMYTNSSNLQALGNSNQADTIGVVSNAEERATCSGTCGEVVFGHCASGCLCTACSGEGKGSHPNPTKINDNASKESVPCTLRD